MEDMGTHEGQRLRQLLIERGIEQVRFADAARITKQGLQKHLNAKVLGRRAWQTVRGGLLAVGIDPSEIRTVDDTPRPTADLIGMVDKWPREQLSTLRTILEADAGARELLLAYLAGALRHA